MASKPHFLGRYVSETAGSTAVVFALLLPVLALLVGGTLDYGQAILHRQHLQAAVDKAALAAARELGLSDARRENVPTVVAAVVTSAMNGYKFGDGDPVLETQINSDPLEVSVSARQPISPVFGGSIGFAPVELNVNAVARIIGHPNICVLSLDPSAAGAISLERYARVTGQNCAVFANSTHNQAIKAKDSAVLSATLICSAGGKDGAKGNFAPEPLTDCPIFDDPLAGRPEPKIEACNPAFPTEISGSVMLSPGTYCGGLTLKAGASVEMDPGIYVFKDGPLRVTDGASLKGSGVGIFLTGSSAKIVFERASTIDLAAPKDGAMAGLLIFEARAQPTNLVHEILSDDARNLLGTIYLSRGRLSIDANNPIADKSAYTAIVAREMSLYGGPHLVLNSSYDQTDVPVPAGIRGVSQPVSLAR